MPPKNIDNNCRGESFLSGMAGSPGICIGKAFLVHQENLDVVDQYTLHPGKVAAEVDRFKKAVRLAEKDLSRLIKKSSRDKGQHIHILEAHKALLKDRLFYGTTIDTIKKARVNAEWALKMTLDQVRQVFDRIKDPYIRERINDVVYVYNRVMRNLTGSKKPEFDKIKRGVILVAHDVSPGDASQMNLECVRGFITEVGGATSHTCIIARTLQIPAVLGVKNATRKINTGDIIILDGRTGKVVINPGKKTLARYQDAKERFEAYQARISRQSHLPSATKDGFSIHVCANIELREEVVAAMDRGADGIGLYRTEFLYLNREDLPEEEELFENYREVVELMDGRPVTIRTLDINGDKVAKGLYEEEADNPALGLRAIRFCITHPQVFITQLRAILRASSHGPVRLLFPMISGVDEIVEARKLLQEAQRQLNGQGVDYDRDLEVGIMIEIPSAAVIADILADHVDFFSIGTNDLIQYTLAVDRGNSHVAHLFQTLHPAVVRLIKRVSDVGQRTGVRLAMCGEMAGDPFNTPLLLGMGFDELSMNPQSVAQIKNAVRALTKTECEAIVESATRQSTQQEVAEIIRERFGELVQNGFAG